MMAEETCPRQKQGQFLDFLAGMPFGSGRGMPYDHLFSIQMIRQLPAVRRLTVEKLETICVRGSIWDRADRVTQACRLERIASKRDRRIGRIGDLTDHLRPCPSILRSTLLDGRDGLKFGRWQDRSVASGCDGSVPGFPPHFSRDYN